MLNADNIRHYSGFNVTTCILTPYAALRISVANLPSVHLQDNLLAPRQNRKIPNANSLHLKHRRWQCSAPDPKDLPTHNTSRCFQRYPSFSDSKILFVVHLELNNISYGKRLFSTTTKPKKVLSKDE